jgi:hypothetical protein
MVMAGPIDNGVRSVMAPIRIDIGKALDDAEDLAQAVLFGRDPQTNDYAKLAEAILLLISIVRLMTER